MVITFKSYLPAYQTMIFENLFEEGLREDEDDKQEMIDRGVSAWMFVDDKLSGEIIGVGHCFNEETLPDVSPEDYDHIYITTMAILPAFQGKGLARLLFAYWMGLVYDSFNVIDCHSTSERMTKLLKTFGARFFKTHKNWFDTDREATYSVIHLEHS